MSDLVRPEAAALAPRLYTFLVLVVAVLFSTTGELFLKIGMNRVGELRLTPGALVQALTEPAVVLGFALFGVGAIFWLWVISRVPLSWAYPMLALGYLIVVLEARWILGEPVPAQRWLGTLIIFGGVYVMYGSLPERLP